MIIAIRELNIAELELSSEELSLSALISPELVLAWTTPCEPSAIYPPSKKRLVFVGLNVPAAEIKTSFSTMGTFTL